MLGLRLRDVGEPHLTWRDLIVIVSQAPRSSALFRASYPEEWEWDLTTMLLADIADHEHIAAWQRGNGKRRDYPEPIPRPGVKPSKTKYGSKPLPLDLMAEWLGWN